ncbi:hypothetical protein KIJ05_08150 [Leuconostoc gelidum subsp. gasicomitatum]|uniref:hypothetical protein n=1 Tax=Leuconostoc gasicomitatum TaxID=115778 RepID=UPI001CC54738|nr:hypothetical protein [Leuconostoc gasicomitatum]MBZ5985085.1 hypothetical protein [Leuconostoc gasicomitatum]
MDTENIPGKWNLYDFTGLPSFDNWAEGAEANSTYRQKKDEIAKNRITYKWVTIISIIVGICVAGSGIGLLVFIIPFLFRKNGTFNKKLTQKLVEVENNFNDALYRHTDMFIKPLAAKLMLGEWKSFRTVRQCLVYSNQRLIYFDVDKELLVAYNKENIKEVSRERLHTGAHTTGQSTSLGGGTTLGKTNIMVGGAQTNTESDVTNFYQWHFDILTDFISYPKVSLILDDSPKVEDLIGTAYSILKP